MRECGYIQDLVALRSNAIRQYLVVGLQRQFGLRGQEEIPRLCSVRICNSMGPRGPVLGLTVMCCSIEFLNHTGKGKFHSITYHECPERSKMYCSSPSLTSSLDEGGWSTPHPSCFTPGNDPEATVQEAGWSQAQSGQVRKNSPPPEFDSRTAQLAVSRHTDCAVPAHIIYKLQYD